ncbi:MAG: hypothetical protein ACLQPD_23135 [Desulfomonilaceae bacterium]
MTATRTEFFLSRVETHVHTYPIFADDFWADDDLVTQLILLEALGIKANLFTLKHTRIGRRF